MHAMFYIFYFYIDILTVNIFLFYLIFPHMLFFSFNYLWMNSVLMTINFMKICIFSVKTCARVDVGHATPNPDTASYNYNTDVTYTCDQAYIHTDGDLVRTLIR